MDWIELLKITLPSAATLAVAYLSIRSNVLKSNNDQLISIKFKQAIVFGEILSEIMRLASDIIETNFDKHQSERQALISDLISIQRHFYSIYPIGQMVFEKNIRSALTSLSNNFINDADATDDDIANIFELCELAINELRNSLNPKT